ncbi:MAG TPA: response regulator [Rhodanobacter sp.]
MLVVDDDHAVLETMQILLESHGGFQVHCAMGSLGATACLSAHEHFDIIVADVLLAGETTGIDVCSLGRRLFPQVGLVVISADRDSHQDDLPERSVYLRKPFGGKDLVAAIEQAQQLVE